MKTKLSAIPVLRSEQLNIVFALTVLAAVGIPIAVIAAQSDEVKSNWSTAAFLDFATWASVMLLGAACLAISRIANRSLVIVAVSVVYLAFGVGAAAIASTSYFVISAYCLGRLWIKILWPSQRGKAYFVESAALGIGSYICLFGLLLHYTVNYRVVYIVLLGLPVLFLTCSGSSGSSRAVVARLLRNGRRALSQVPYWQLCLAALSIGWVAHYAFFPSIGFDDNAMHLRIWTVLSERHFYDFDVTSQIWAASPFSVDLLHAVVSLVAESDARGSLNLFLFAALLLLLWSASRTLGCTRSSSLLSVVLFSSTPMVAHLLATLQTELFMSVLAIAGVYLILQRSAVFFDARTAAVIMIGAMCVATKAPGAVLGLTLFLSHLSNLPRHERLQLKARRGDLLKAVALILLYVVVAAHSYVVAALKTGNPLFPLYNGYFNSPLFPNYNFLDLRYVTGANLQGYWNLFFDTGKYFESSGYVAGFQYLLLFPLAVLSFVVQQRRREAWIILWPLLGYGLTMFATVQYWRYLFPVLPLASLLIGTLLISSRAAFRGNRGRSAVAALVLCTGLNFVFLPGISWYFRASPTLGFSEEGRRSLVDQFAPEQSINKRLNRIAPGAHVLFDPDRPFGATLTQSPIYVNWYSPERAKRVVGWKSTDDVIKFFQDENIHFVYWNLAVTSDASDKYRVLLQEYLSRFAVPQYQVGSILAYRVREKEVQYVTALKVQYSSESSSTAYGKERQLQLTALPAKTKIGEVGVDMVEFGKFSVVLDCPADKATFVAHISWDHGSAYDRFINCSGERYKFSETFIIPVGARKGEVFASLYGDNGEIGMKKIEIGLGY